MKEGMASATSSYLNTFIHSTVYTSSPTASRRRERTAGLQRAVSCHGLQAPVHVDDKADAVPPLAVRRIRPSRPPRRRSPAQNGPRARLVLTMIAQLVRAGLPDGRIRELGSVPALDFLPVEPEPTCSCWTNVNVAMTAGVAASPGATQRGYNPLPGFSPTAESSPAPPCRTAGSFPHPDSGRPTNVESPVKLPFLLRRPASGIPPLAQNTCDDNRACHGPDSRGLSRTSRLFSNRSSSSDDAADFGVLQLPTEANGAAPFVRAWPGSGPPTTP
ncbi:hypothetical protein QBC39DRAFT_104424 [Podospora conica]|nr:hypothetical protein QBC39DRAFT_104424 [Schizothecium conicum]